MRRDFVGKRRAASLVSLATFGHLLVSAAAHAQAPPAPYDAYPPPRLRQPLAGPVVQLSTDNPAARLQMMTQLKWVNICIAPCGAMVDPSGLYRIGGGTVRPSEEFRMPRPAGTVLVQTEVGSNVKHWVGFGMVLGGAGAMLAGFTFLSAASNTQSDGLGGAPLKDAYHTEGVFFLVGGAIVAAIGIPLLMSSTSVDVH